MFVFWLFMKNNLKCLKILAFCSAMMLKLMAFDRSITGASLWDSQSKVKDFSNFDLVNTVSAYFEQSKVLRDTTFLFEQNSIHISLEKIDLTYYRRRNGK